MTDLATTAPAEIATRRTGPLAVPLGALGGLLLGVTARAWMRFISDDPQFTWSGTLFIVGGFTVFGTAQGTVRFARRSSRRWVVSLARLFGSVLMLPLFAAAGSVMLPTVVCFGLVTARPGWKRWERWAACAVGAVPMVFVSSTIIDSFGWSLHSAAGIAMAIGVYATVVRMARPTFSAHPAGVHIPGWLRASAAALISALLVVFALGAFLTRT